MKTDVILVIILAAWIVGAIIVGAVFQAIDKEKGLRYPFDTLVVPIVLLWPVAICSIPFAALYQVTFKITTKIIKK